MAGKLEQIAAFGTDIVGLERLLRGFQATCQIMLAYPVTLALFLPTTLTADAAASISLLQLQRCFALTRRTLRLFRFLDSFNAGWRLFHTEDKDIETWLDVVSKSALSLYGLLESITLLDMAGIDNLQIFSVARTKSLNYEAQIFWFVALYASAIITGLKLLRLFGLRPVPKTGAGYGTGEEPTQQAEPEKPPAESTAEKPEAELTKEEALDKERRRLKEIVRKQKERRKVLIRETISKARGLCLKLLTDVLDMLLPATAVGWIRADAGLVGMAMLSTTYITGRDVWDRCGQELLAKRG